MPLSLLPAATPVGSTGHALTHHPTIHQILNTIITEQSNPGAIPFSNSDGDLSFDATNLIYDDGTDTLTVQNLDVNGTLTATITGGGVSGFTPGAVIFGSGTGTQTEDPTALFFNAATDQLRLANGTTAVPSLGFVNSTGTGLQRPGADTLGVSTAGVQRWQTNDVGAISIGTTNVNGTWLRVGGGATFPVTTTTPIGLDVDFTSPATATSTHIGVGSKIRTTASVYTVSLARGFMANSPTVGAGSAITLIRGVDVANQGATGIAGATGIYVQAQSGASSSNYGIQIEAATTATLLVSANADNTTAAAGIAFGSSRDTTLFRAATSLLSTGGSFAIAGTAASENARLSITYPTALAGSGSGVTAGIRTLPGTLNFTGAAQTQTLQAVTINALTVTADNASSPPDLSGLRVIGPIASTNVTPTRTQALFVQTGANTNVGLDVRGNSSSQSGAFIRLTSSSGASKFEVLPVSGDGEAINLSILGTTGLKIGTATTQKLAFYNSAPVAQQAGVADASGGAIIDSEARTAINTIISRLETLGLIATV